jgi:hypothetical protein
MGYIRDPGNAIGTWDGREILKAEFYSHAADWTGYLDWIRDQGQTSACVAFGVARAVQLRARLSFNPRFEHPSVRLLYDHASGVLGLRGTDSGATIAAASSALDTVGFAPENACPWDALRVTTPIALHEYLAAIDQRKVRMHRLYQVGEPLKATIKTAISEGYPIVIGKAVDESYFDHASSDVWQGMQGPMLGGHCTCSIGYDPESLVEVNSWGPGWGADGQARISWDYVLGPNTWALWVVDFVPDYARAA